MPVSRKFRTIPARWYLAALVPCVVMLGGNALAADTAAQTPHALKATVQEDAKLNSSIKVLPGTLNGASQAPPVQQFAASGTYHPGQAAPIPKPPPKVVPPLPMTAGLGLKPGTPAINLPPKPPPKWDYTITPKSGLMDYTPGPHIKVMTPPPEDKRNRPPKLGPNEFHSWSDFYKRSGRAPEESGFIGRHILKAQQPVPQVVPLMATPMAMPGVVVPKATTWDEWYRRVTKAIYDQWTRTQTGPGTSRVKVVVFNTHDLDCQIVDFMPATDTQRNADAETHFRESAIHCINNLRHCEILGFPYSANKQKVSFELSMSRSVNGPAGCDLKSIEDKELK